MPSSEHVEKYTYRLVGLLNVSLVNNSMTHLNLSEIGRLLFEIFGRGRGSDFARFAG